MTGPKFSRLLTAAELFTGNLNNFRGIFNWTLFIGQTTTVIVMRIKADGNLDQIIEDRDSKNTKSVIKLAVQVLNDYLIEKNGEIASVNELDLFDTSVDIVVATLKRFYGEIRKAGGTLYAIKSIITLMFGLQKHFLKSRKEDIINSEHYSAANAMFKAVMVKLVKEGKGTVKHKEVILPEDLQTHYGHVNFSNETPEALHNRVFFEYLYYFCNRGRENLRDVQKEDFELKVDGQGRRYITLKFQRQTKNHRCRYERWTNV